MNNQNFISKNSTKICFAKKQKGITLVALIVTIIVLLILAGVSLSLVAGSNGILNRANNAVSKTKEAQLKEELQLGLAEIMMDYYIEGNGKSLQEYIIEQCNKAENNGMLEVGNGIFSSIDGELYYTDSNGNISMIQVTDKGEVSIEGSVSADGTVNDTNPPSIFATATTNAISLVIKDPLSGVAGWAYSATNTEPTTWNEVTGKPKSHSETITGLTNGTTYYVWAKDANGNVSQAKEVRTKDFDELSYDVSWEGAMATITVKTPSMGVQFKISETEEWQDYSESNKPSVASNTTVYFQVTDGTNTVELSSVKPVLTYTVKYNGNGNTSGSMNSSKHEYGTESLLLKNQFKKEGFVFIGWAKKPDSDKIDFVDEAKALNLLENNGGQLDLFAVWFNDLCTFSNSTSLTVSTSDTYRQTEAYVPCFCTVTIEGYIAMGSYYSVTDNGAINIEFLPEGASNWRMLESWYGDNTNGTKVNVGQASVDVPGPGQLRVSSYVPGHFTGSTVYARIISLVTKSGESMKLN